jgi:ASCH domain
MRQQPPEDLLRAISIRQPYVEQILRGTKRAEYRSRPTKVRGRVYLYAALKPADVEGRGIPDVASLPRGLIVGSVEIVDCVLNGGTGFAWKLRKPRRYRNALRAKGQPQPAFWHPRFR